MIIMNKQDFLIVSGLEIQALEFWIEQEWIIPQNSSSGPAFFEKDVARAHLIQDLQRDFGVNDEGVDLVLHLMDQLHGMRRVLEALHSDLQEKPL